jgi:hypothetical protein
MAEFQESHPPCESLIEEPLPEESMTPTLLPLALVIAIGWPGTDTIQVQAVPKEVRDLEGNYTGKWTMYGIDPKGEVVKRATWTDTLKATSAEVKEDQAFVTWKCEQTFDGAKGPPRKSEGKEGFFLKKDGTVGDNFLEMFGQTTRLAKLSPTSWSYATTAAPQELAALGFPKGASGEHVTVKMVSKDDGTETHHITRVTTVTWADKGGKERVTHFVSLNGYHKRGK